MIPKIIHQTYSSIDALPPELHENIVKIKANNPDWQYCFYANDDCKDFIHDHYGAAVLARYERINPLYKAARADLFRYLLMYKMGGCYIDIKSTLEGGLSNRLRADDRFILSTWKNQPGEEFEGWGLFPEEGINEYQQWHIIAAEGHPYLAAVIDDVLENIECYSPFVHGVGAIGVLRITGPIAYTKAIARHFDPAQHREVDVADLGVRYSIYSKAELKARPGHYSSLRQPVVSNSRTHQVLARLGLGSRLWQNKKKKIKKKSV